MLNLLILSLVAGAFCASPEENGGLFEGDMELTPEQQYAAENGLDVSTAGGARGSVTFGRWPQATLVYDIEASLANERTAVKAIEDGMNDWTSKTCIKFKRRKYEAAFVSFYRGGGCSSAVGRRGSMQRLSLARGCWRKGTVAHEIGHALGLFHEQSRPDRDSFVRIEWENIRDSARHNFKKYSRSTIDSLGEPYDYDSVMHYGARYFSKNRRPTIVPLQQGVFIGQRNGLSAGDARQARKMYKC